MIGDNKTIALVMIVKDESHVILKTLQNILDNVNLDSWYITDTGSTDGTQELIINFFKEKNIPGELFYNEWVNFGHNRSLSIANAFGKSDYILLFDADDHFVGNFKECVPKVLNKETYNLTLSTCPGFFYKRPLIVSNNNKKFFYEGCLHEYLTCKESFTNDDILGNYHVHGGTIGNDDAKYARDAIVFEKALANISKEEEHLIPRYTFYLAQSYRDSRQNDKAIETYIKRTTLGGWAQEIYVSFYEAAKLSVLTNNLINGFYYAMSAHNILPNRLEALRIAVGILRAENKLKLAYILLKTINLDDLDVDHSKHLFCHKYVYDWEISYEFSIIAFHNSDYNVIPHYRRILRFKDSIPKHIIDNCISNIQFYISKVNKNDAKKLEKIKSLLS